MTRPATLPDLLRQARAADAERVALEVHAGARLTYGGWDRRSDAQADGLQRAGVLPGDRVALLFDAAQWSEYAVSYLAVHKAAAVAVPLRTGLGAVELARIMNDCRASALVAAPGAAPASPVPTFGPAELQEGASEPIRAPVVRLTAMAEILYATGPLSPPVAVARDHRALLGGPSFAFADAGGAPSLLHAFAVGTAAGQDALFASLRPAPVRSLVLPAFDPDQVGALLAGGAATACALHPATAQALIDSAVASRHDLSRVSGLVLSGGRVHPALLMALSATLPRAALLLIDVLGHVPGARTVFTHDRSRPGSVGVLAGGAAIEVLGDDGRPLACGQVGDVCIAAGSLERTGDLGYVDADGFLYLVSGRHDVVRHRRAGVSRVEVESALREHPAVGDAVALDVARDRSASELGAAVVATSPVSASDLRAHVRVQLGDGKAPEQIHFVDDLPRNDSGILLRHELGRRLRLASDTGERAEHVAGQTQETVASICRRVLDRSEIEPHEDFFELGGNLTAAARVVALLEDAFGVRLRLSAVLEAPTVAGVARAVDRLCAGGEHGHHTPVGFSQQGMLWQECFAPGSQNLPGLARRYRGPLDTGALHRALDEIVRRHGALRTTFAIDGGRAMQVVRPHRPLDLPVADLTTLGTLERDADVARRVAQAGQRPFDLVGGPLFEPALLCLGAEDHVLVLRAHHAIFDDWSVGVFRRELAALYSAYAAGEASSLAEPPLQFAGFVRSQRRRLAGAEGERQMSFWRRELEGAPLITQLAVDDPQRPEGSRQVAGAPVSLALPAELRDALRGLARRERTTLYMTMLAAFGVLVRRYTGQDDLLMATVVANRNATKLEGLIGCFTKKVPLRLRLTGDPSFSEVLGRTRKALLGALSHQDLPFEDVIQDVLGAAAASHGLVPHVGLMFQGVTPRQELKLPGLQTTGFETSDSAARAHFTASDDGESSDEAPALPWGAGLYLGTFVIVSVIETAGELSCVARGAFHGPAVQALMRSYSMLLADVVADPARRVSELTILAPHDERELLERGRGPSEEDLATATIAGAMREQVRRAPAEIAIDCDGETISYAELASRCDRLAACLRARGVGRGARVGIALDASADAVVAALAICGLGAAWVALDPHDDADRLAWIASDAALRVVVTAGGSPALPGGLAVVATDAVPDREAATERAAPAVAEPDDEATIFYGAGDSATSHGVALDHRCVGNLLAGLRAVLPPPTGAEPARRVLLCAPWQDGFLRQLALLLDGHRLCAPVRLPRADPRAVVALLAADRLDTLDCTPDGLQGLLDAGLREALQARPSGATEPTLVVGTRAATGPELWHTLAGLPRVRAHVLYGPPECAFGATAAGAAGAATARGVGRSLANVACHVLDAEGSPVPARAVGELHLAGASLARGHLGDPADTRARFVERALAGQATRLLRTGQLARSLPDGGVELLGPVDGAQMRGVRIDTDRIRSALRRSPDVRDVTVALEAHGETDRRLVARVTSNARPPTLEELRAALWSRLPGYVWPSRASGVSAHDRAEQTILAAFWAGLLGLERLEPHENYWQSFSFLDALDRAHAAGVDVPTRAVTANRTLETLAAAVPGERRRSS